MGDRPLTTLFAQVNHPKNNPREHSTRRRGFVLGCTACMGVEEHVNMYVSAGTRARWECQECE